MSHTPGPWATDPEDDAYAVFSPSHGNGEPVAIANGPEDARLIAAAPDLLAALRACCNFLDDVEETIGPHLTMPQCVNAGEVLDAGRAAIAQAEGEE